MDWVFFLVFITKNTNADANLFFQFHKEYLETGNYMTLKLNSLAKSLPTFPIIV